MKAYQPDARFPVLLRHGDVTWVIWGKRKLEGSGKFPNGSWAGIDSIKMGKWKPWHPRPVLIPAESFMEKDHDKQSHWISLAPGMAFQALLRLFCEFRYTAIGMIPKYNFCSQSIDFPDQALSCHIEFLKLLI